MEPVNITFFSLAGGCGALCKACKHINYIASGLFGGGRLEFYNAGVYFGELFCKSYELLFCKFEFLPYKKMNESGKSVLIEQTFLGILSQLFVDYAYQV